MRPFEKKRNLKYKTAYAIFPAGYAGLFMNLIRANKILISITKEIKSDLKGLINMYVKRTLLLTSRWPKGC